jgi:acid phosphatase type 7
MKKGILLILVIVLSYTGFTQAVVTVGPYLQSPTPNSIKILWRSDVAATSKVMYGTNPANLTQTVTDAASVTRHSVLVTGLAPYTKYFYAIYNDNTFAEGGDSAHSFRTFPVAGTNTPVRAWVIGDFGKGNSKQQIVRDSYQGFDSIETNLWLWLGDNVYNDGTEQEYLTKVFDSVYGYQKIMKSLPFEPTPGNHDYNSVSPVQSPVAPLSQTGPYLDLVDVYKNAEAGGVATGHELFYSFDYANVHFVSLNSELGSIFSGSDDWIGANPFINFTSSPLTQWLHQDLSANTKPWVVVYFHQPPYTDGSHDSGSFWEIYMKAVRENLAEIWEQYGVDLVLSGHSHVYERSYLVKGSYGDAADITPFNILQNTSGVDAQGQAYVKHTQGSSANQGTVYVVNGNSGSTDDAPNFNHPYMVAEYGCDTCVGSFILDVDSNRLDGRHLDAYGNIRDHFTIYKVFGYPTGVQEAANIFISGLKVTPNPFSNSTTVTFELLNSENVKLRLTDVTGRLVEVFEGNLSKGNQTLEVDAQKLKLAKGTYTLQLSAGKENFARTIILQ